MKGKKIISIVILAALLLSVTNHSIYATENKGNNQTSAGTKEQAEVGDKSEVVYANLSPDGSVNAIYIVNHFKIVKGGTITDYGNYSSVKNLSVSEPITMEGDQITLQAEEGDFYYQGNMEDRELPWNINIGYELNGKEVLPQDIAGKSGELGITIKTERNEEINSTFYENYMLQISVTLPSEKSSNINAPDATIAEAGNNTMLAFTVMPNTEAMLKVTAKVKDFEMKGIDITAMPFTMSIDIPDTDGMLEELEQLPKAISDLNDGVGELAKGTADLKKGAESLRDGSVDFERGLSDLKKNSTGMISASSQINNALSTISTSLGGGASEADMSSISQLPPALGELSKGLTGISDGLKELNDGYAMAYQALDQAIQGIPDAAISKEQLDGLFRDANKEQLTMLNQLYGSYLAGQAVKGTYTQVKQAFAAVAPTLENVTMNIDTIAATLEEMSTKLGSSLPGMDITSQLTQLTEGLSELAINYSQFDLGLKDYMNGVSSLSTGYEQFNSGLTTFVSGVDDMNDGVSELYEGTEQMNAEISTLPDQMQKEIDTLTKDYDKSDFVPESFVSSKNTDTGLVQFVLKGDEIKLPESNNTATQASEEEEETVIDRFLALFRKEKE